MWSFRTVLKIVQYSLLKSCHSQACILWSCLTEGMCSYFGNHTIFSSYMQVLFIVVLPWCYYNINHTTSRVSVISTLVIVGKYTAQDVKSIRYAYDLQRRYRNILVWMKVDLWCIWFLSIRNCSLIVGWGQQAWRFKHFLCPIWGILHLSWRGGESQYIFTCLAELLANHGIYIFF